jgi:hypothetical protein
MLARHVSSIARLDNGSRHVPVVKTTWGPLLWLFFHGMGSLLARIETPSIRDSLTKQMWVITREVLDTIPCPYCRSHAIEEYNAKRMIDDSTSNETRNAYQLFFYEFHNRVNARLQKPTVPYEVMLATTNDINPSEKVQEYYRSINGYRIWLRRDEFLAKFNANYQSIQETLSRERDDALASAISSTTVVTPSMS